MKTFVTLISSDAYLPGVIALNHSLKKHQSQYPLFAIITPDVSAESRDLLSKIGVQTKEVDIINVPLNILKKSPNFDSEKKRFLGTYTKFHIFNLVEFEKIVYVDADMMVYQNIDELFDAPNWSSVVMGGKLPQHDWRNLNSGLLVLIPDNESFKEIKKNIPYVYSYDGGDQGFLQTTFWVWRTIAGLQLDDKYNMFTGFLDQYHALFDYDLPHYNPANPVSVVHYCGPEKPWKMKKREGTSKQDECINIWLDEYKIALKTMPPDVKETELYNSLLSEMAED